MDTPEELILEGRVPVIRRTNVHHPHIVMERILPTVWANSPVTELSPESAEYLEQLQRIGITQVVILLPDDGVTYRIDIKNRDGTHYASIDAEPPMTDDEVNELLGYIPRPGENDTLSEVLSYALKSGSVPGFELRHEYFVRHIADCIQQYGFRIVREVK